MSWNYRIIEYPTYRELSAVYYDPKGRPEAYSDVKFVEGNPGDLADGLERALDSVRKLPILPVSVFDLPIEERPVV